MADHSVNAVLHRMSFHPFLLLTIRKPSFSSRRVRKRSSAQSRIQTSAPPRVVIRVSLKVSKFRASGRVKFIALGPPAPSWGRPLVNSTSPMLFQCPAAEHGGIAAVPHAGYQPKSAVSDARRDHTRSNMLGLGWRCPLWVISGHLRHVRLMSALPPKADIAECDHHVRQVPIAHIQQPT